MASLLRTLVRAPKVAATLTSKSLLAAPATTTTALPASVLGLVHTQKRLGHGHAPTSHYLDRSVVQERVMGLLGSYPKIPKDKLTTTSHFSKDLGLDSLDCVEVCDVSSELQLLLVLHAIVWSFSFYVCLTVAVDVVLHIQHNKSCFPLPLLYISF